MIKKSYVIIVIFLNMMLSSAFSQELQIGTWRFELRTHNATIPFLMEITKKNDQFDAVILNGKEKINLENIEIKPGQVIIPIRTFELTLELARQKKGKMAGYLIRHNRQPKSKIPVVATFNKKIRFQEKLVPSKLDLNGKWSINLIDEQDKKSKGVLIFEQNNHKITGSILSPTGDYRFFEGVISGNEFMAASFDGVYNYLLKGEVNDGKLVAKILSNYVVKIDGVKDTSASLPNAYEQTQIQNLEFEFPDLNGKTISLKDEKFKNKAVVIQFFGSWCPNCLDEMNYLIPWYNQNKSRGVEIIALAFERSLDKKKASKQLLKTQKKYEIPYTILLAGSTSEDKPQEKIKGLKNFIAFPTTVFLNKKHQVIKIHAGFSGPGTGEFFELWKIEFNQNVDEALRK